MLASTADLDDTELMARVQADDADAFRFLFDRFATMAYRVAYSIVRDGGRGEDVVQEAFLSAWRTRGAYCAERGSVGAWLMGIVRHRALDSVRRNARHDDRRADEERITEGGEAPGGIEDAVAEREQAIHLRGVLARLPVAQREVIALAYFGELSSSEIASELALPLGTVKGRMRLGLEKLREDRVSS